MLNLFLADITTGEANTLVKAAHDVAQESDRVLFLITMGLGLAFTGFVIKFLVRKNDEAQKRAEEAMTNYYLAMQKFGEAIIKLTDSIDNNSEVLKEHKQILDVIKGKIGIVLLIAVSAAFMTTGCMINKPYAYHVTEEYSTEGKLIKRDEQKVAIPSIASWPSNQEIAKQRASLGKTLSLGSSSVDQEGATTNLTENLKGLTELLKAIRGY